MIPASLGDFTNLASPVRRSTAARSILTGNFYRSRFAEVYFNRVASRDGLPWRAFSRGLEVGQHPENVGPISRLTVDALAERGIPLPEPLPEPEQLTRDDLETADLSIALKEAEHRKVIRRLFPEWENRVEYWSIHDLDAAPAESAIPELQEAVDRLLRRLGGD